MLMVSWTAPYSGHATLSIESYGVQYRTSKSGTRTLGTTPATLPGDDDDQRHHLQLGSQHGV